MIEILDFRASSWASLAFWSAFVFSIGPFWIATMEAARSTSFAVLYRNYLIYSLVGWLPINMFLGITTGLVGRIDDRVYTVLYFVGAGVILWMAFKTLSRKPSGGAGFDFNWRTMTLVSWTNPKVYLTIPPGTLAANFTDSLTLNVFLFFLVGFPLFLVGVYLWGSIGRQGARLAPNRIGWINAALLAGFALYLLWEGFERLAAV